MNFKIGVLSDSFRLPPMEGIRKAKELGADGFQVYVVDGPLAPEVMTARDRQEFRRFCRNLSIEPFALCGDLGGHGFERAEENPAKIERSCRIVDLAVDFGCSVVTTHIGVIPEDPSDPRYRTMKEACRRLGAYAAPRGVTFAIETGPEPATVLRRFLDDLAQPGLGVNLDPANLVMVIGEDPVAAVASLGPYLVHTHAKDGRQLQPCNPREVYGAFADGGFAALEQRMGKLFIETPLGEGAVPWAAYLRALERAGFSGALTIEREVGADPEADIRRAVTFLRRLIGRRD
jgi:L-ribulose-5-phosphate 3-epimerase